MLRSELYLQRWYSQLVITTTISMHHHEQESNRGKHIQDRLATFFYIVQTVPNGFYLKR